MDLLSPAPSPTPIQLQRLQGFPYLEKVSLQKLNTPPPTPHQGEYGIFKAFSMPYSFSFWSNKWLPILYSSVKQFKVYLGIAPISPIKSSHAKGTITLRAMCWEINFTLV